MANIAQHSSFQKNLKYILLGGGKKRNKVYRIPDYQRGYAWEEKQVREMWEDILALFYNEKNHKHYTGMIVLDPIRNHDEKQRLLIEANDGQTNAYYVVDGQQRLTTLIIFLHSITNAIDSVENLKDQENSDCFIYSDAGIAPETYRFGYCDESLNEFFKGRVFKNEMLTPKNIYEKNIDFACKFAEKVMYRFDHESLKRIKNILLNDILFNLYGITDEFDVRTTFETMNNRGKRLSTLELLKNRLMYLADQFDAQEAQSLIREIDTSWNVIYKNLSISKDETLNDDDFVRAHWFLYHKATKLKGDSFKSEIFDEYFKIDVFAEKIRKSYLTKSSSTNEAYNELLNYVESLRNCSSKWAYINNQKAPVASEVENSLSGDSKLGTINMIKRLSRIPNQGGSKYLYPILMGTIYKEPQHPDKRFNFYCDLERYIFLNSCIIYTTKNDLSGFIKDLHPMIRGTNYDGAVRTADQVFDDLSNTLKYSLYAPSTLFNKNNIDKTISAIKGNFLEKCFNKDDKGFYSWNGIRYFLYDYDESLNKKEGTYNQWTDFGETSIEHIFPETPLSTRFEKAKEYWEITFKDYLPNTNDLKENERNRKITNLLGNLVLLGDSQENSSISNHSYPVKCGSGVCLTSMDIELPSTKFTYIDSFKSAKEVVNKYGRKVIRGHLFPEDVIARTEELLDYLWERWISPVAGNTLSNSRWKSLYNHDYIDPLKQHFISKSLDKKQKKNVLKQLNSLVSDEVKDISTKGWTFNDQIKQKPYSVIENFKRYYLESEFNVDYRFIHQNKNEAKYYKQDTYVVLTKTFNDNNLDKPQIERITLLLIDGNKNFRFSWDAKIENGIVIKYDWNENDEAKEYIEHLKTNNRNRGFVNCFYKFGCEEQKAWIGK